jgi:hypothetical protein
MLDIFYTFKRDKGSIKSSRVLKKDIFVNVAQN